MAIVRVAIGLPVSGAGGGLTASVASGPSPQHAARSALSERGAQYDALGRPTAFHGERFEYDDAGRLCARHADEGVWRYTWSADSRLVRVDAPSHVVQLAYDARGRRLAKQVFRQGELVSDTSYVWTNNTPLHEVDELSGSSRTYMRPDEEERWSPVGHVDVIAGREVPTYYIEGTADRIDFAVDETGAIVWSAHHTLLGDCTPTRDAVSVSARFANQFYDADVGLTYNYERWYEPRLGVYISPDPLGLDGPLNPIAYVANPLLFGDPDGLGKKPPRRPTKVASPGPNDHYPEPGDRPDRPKSADDMNADYMTRPGHWARGKDAKDKNGKTVPGHVDCPPDFYAAAGKDWNKDKSIRKNLDKAGKTYGCHSCGSKKPGGPNWPKGKKQPAHFVPDHVPPHTTFPDVKKGDRKAKVTPKPPRKGSVKLYPQCHTCSNSSGSMIDKMSKGKTGSCYSENVKANRAEGKR